MMPAALPPHPWDTDDERAEIHRAFDMVQRAIARGEGQARIAAGLARLAHLVARAQQRRARLPAGAAIASATGPRRFADLTTVEIAWLRRARYDDARRVFGVGQSTIVRWKQALDATRPHSPWLERLTAAERAAVVSEPIAVVMRRFGVSRSLVAKWRRAIRKDEQS